MNQPSIVYFGMPHSELSRRPLEALLQAGAGICAVIVPGTADEPDPIALDPPASDDIPDLDFVPLVSRYLAPSVITLAWEHDLPIFAIGDLKRPAARETLAALRPDLSLVSCFSKIIPPAILELAPALNLHPSLLPRYRGPWPLFWQFKHGEAEGGVTLHYVSERVDAGDIVEQTPVPLREGIGAPDVEQQCAEAGAQLILRNLPLLERGEAPRMPQAEHLASYHPLPTRADLTIDARLPARQAFNFIRGAADLIGEAAFEIQAGERLIRTRTALSYQADARLGAAVEAAGQAVAIQFNPGVLRVEPLNE